MLIDEIESAMSNSSRPLPLHRLLESRGEADFNRLTGLTVRLMNVSAALISLMDEGGHIIISGAGPAAPVQFPLPLPDLFYPHSDEPGQPLTIEDTEHNALTQASPTLNGVTVRAYASLLLLTPAGDVVGALCVVCTAPRVWTADDLATLKDLAALAMTQIELRTVWYVSQNLEASLDQRHSVELAQHEETLQAEITERQSTQQRLRRQNRYMVAINEIALAAIHRLNLIELLDVISRQAATLVEGADSGIWLVDPDEAGLTLRTGTGRLQPYIGFKARSGEGMAGKVWQSGQPMIVDDYATWNDQFPEPSVKTFHAMVAMPLRSEGHVVGILTMTYAQPHKTFPLQDIALLERFAEIAAIAIVSAQTILALHEELAERQRAEALLAQERNLLRTLLDNLPDHIFVKDTQGRYTISNIAHTRSIRVVSDVNIVGKLPTEVFLPEAAKQLHTEDMAVLDSGHASIDIERLVPDSTGALHWLLSSKIPFNDAQGQLIGLIGITRDITERKQAELLLEQERNLLRTLIDNIPDYIFVKDIEGRFTISNEAHTLAAQASSDTGIVGKLPTDLFPTDLAEQFHADDLAILNSGQPLINVERQTVDAAGAPRWVLTTKVPFKDKYGQLIGLVGISRDITERMDVENELQTAAMENADLYDRLRQHADELEQRVAERTKKFQEAKEQAEAILDNSSDAILVIALSGDIQQVNPAFNQLFGYPVADALSQPLPALADSGSREKLRETMQYVMQTGQSQRLEITARRRDDSTFEADLALAPILRPDTLTVVGAVCNIRDITRRKLIEQELRLTLEKERELNDLKTRFVSLVSHEFRTPLAIILAASNILKSYGDRLSSTEKQDRFSKIERGIAQMTSLLEDVLTVSSGEAGQLRFNPVPLDLGIFCWELLSEVQTIWGQNHLFEFTRQGRTTQVTMDPQLLQHILLNLLSNAVKHSPEGSTVHFDVACEPTIATFSIRDEGLGIPVNDQQKLFEAFHRGENVNGIAGTGLGLTIVKQAVLRHGGTIHFESRINVGTLFVVTIPSAPTEQSQT